jgi:xylulokinase
MSFIGIDLGATFLKGAWLHPERGELSGVQREPFPAFTPGLPPGRREVTAAAVLAAVTRLLENLLAASPEPCAGILFCGQMHGFVLVAADGTGRSDFISWQDTRALARAPAGTGTCFDELRAALGPDRISQLGNELRPGSPLAALHAMSVRGELPRGAAPLSLPDYVALALGGRLDRPATDATNAAAHGALHVADRAWHREAVQRLGLDHLRWPEILPSGGVLGRWHGAGREIPLHVPIGDQQAALLGAGLGEGELSLNIATGSQVSRLADTPAAGDWQLRPFTDHRWLRTVTHLPAGRALNAMLGLLGELAADQGTPLRDPWAQVARLAAATPPPRLRANLAFFPSAVGDEGGFDQLTEDELKAGPLFHAAFRSMASNYLQAAHRIAPQGWSQVVFSGGLVQKLPVLQAIILEQLASGHRLAPQAEDTLQGLMQLARRPATRG